MVRLMCSLSIMLSALLFGCKKETPAQVVPERDTVYITVRDTLTIPSVISDTTTTIIVLRHAEKENSGSDPNLNSEGVVRAEELKRILANIAVNAIYSTPYNRTRQTVQPLAAAKGIAITEYAVGQSYQELINGILTTARGKVVVIVGHSNTVPEILKNLTDNSFNVTITESQYDNLFIVAVPDHLSATVTPLKYGKYTP